MLLVGYEKEYRTLVHPTKTLQVDICITRKVAEVSIDEMPTSELQTILELWDELGRTWAYEQEVKPFYFPKFKIGEEVKR